jgi:hypothetical protein
MLSVADAPQNGPGENTTSPVALEKRGATRFRAAASPLLVADDQTARPRSGVAAVDVSMHGCRVAGYRNPLMVGSVVRISLETDPYATDRVWLDAIVVRSTPQSFGRFEAGLRFTPNGFGQYERLRDWGTSAAASGERV